MFGVGSGFSLDKFRLPSGFQRGLYECGRPTLKTPEAELACM